MDEFQHVVAGQRMNITLFDFKLRACRHLEDEQAKANPDNALIALLCEGVRLAREHETDMRRPIPESVHTHWCAYRIGKDCNCRSPQSDASGEVKS